MSVALALCALAAVSCANSPEAALEIRTTALECLEKKGGCALNAMGDSMDLPAGAAEASIRIGDFPAAPILPESRIELALVPTSEAPGSMTRVTVNGEEIWAAQGQWNVYVEWVARSRRDLPPKIETIEIETDAQGEMEVDAAVMYVDMPDSKLENVKTEVKIVGSGAEGFEWIPEPAEGLGRVKGKVKSKSGALAGPGSRD